MAMPVLDEERIGRGRENNRVAFASCRDVECNAGGPDWEDS